MNLTINNQILTNNNLALIDKLVLSFFSQSADENGISNLKSITIAEIIDVTPATVCNSVRRLKKLNYLERFGNCKFRKTRVRYKAE